MIRTRPFGSVLKRTPGGIAGRFAFAAPEDTAAEAVGASLIESSMASRQFPSGGSRRLGRARFGLVICRARLAGVSEWFAECLFEVIAALEILAAVILC